MQRKPNTAPKRYIREIRGVNLAEYEVGQELKVDHFHEGEFVDVTGTSKGKGFPRCDQTLGPKPRSDGSRFQVITVVPGSMGSIRSEPRSERQKLPGHMGT